MELNIFDIEGLSARTWRHASGSTCLEITLVRESGKEDVINLVTRNSWEEFGLAAKGINEAFS